MSLLKELIGTTRCNSYKHPAPNGAVAGYEILTP